MKTGITARNRLEIFRSGSNAGAVRNGDGAFAWLCRCAPSRRRALELLVGAVATVAACGDPQEGDLFAEPVPTYDGAPAALAFPALRRDHDGDDVMVLQQLLALRGEAVPIDGRFGAATDHAVRALQLAYRLEPDGVVGAETWPRLLRELGPDAPRALRGVAQRLLLDAGLGEADSNDGTLEAEIAALQRQRCLTPTGRLGVVSWSALLSGQSYCPGAAPGPRAALEVARLAREAGLPCGETLVIAVAIATAESNRRSEAVHANGPTTGCPRGSVDVGLWQINDCYHPAVSRTCALTPECNARAMYDISHHGTTWSPWTTFRDGSYARHLPGAQVASDDACR